MLRRFTSLATKTGFPVLGGQFVYDWYGSDLRFAAGNLPLRATLIFAVLLAWAAFREHSERKKRTFR
jgi:hypothetical protein